jgi:hypothetical protein
MKRRVLLFLAGGLAFLLSATVWAHHGWSNYDESRPLTLSGVVLEVLFENPHTEMMLEVWSEGEPTGEVWEVVLPPPSRAQRLGLTAETLQVDMTVTVEGYPHRSIEAEMRATSILLEEGEEPILLR